MAKKPTPDQLRALINQIDGLDDELDFEPTISNKQLEEVIAQHRTKAVYDDLHPTLKTSKIHDINIEFVSAPCAAGKTYALIQALRKQADKKYLIAVPTIKLANQYYNNLMEYPETASRTSMFHKEVSYNVPAELQEALSQAKAGSIIICTQAAIDLINNGIVPSDIIYVFDEIPSVVKSHKLLLPYNHHMITNHMKVEELELADSLFKVTAVDTKKVDAFFRLNKDVINQYLEEVLIHLKNNDALFALKSQYTKLVLDNIITPDKDHLTEHGNELNTLYFIGIENPSKLVDRKVIIMGADFEESLLHYAWKEYYGVSFSKNTEITNELRYTTHPQSQGDRLIIIVEQETKVTGGAQRKIREDGKSNLTKRFENMSDVLADEKVMAVTNIKDQKAIPANFEMVQPKAHGRNDLVDCTGAVIPLCINLDNTHKAMMLAIGITDEMFDRAENSQVIYQNAFRTNLRDLDSNKLVTISVGDMARAAYFKERLPTVTIINKRGEVVTNPHLFDNRTKSEKKTAKAHEDKFLHRIDSTSIPLDTESNPCKSGTSTPPDVMVTFNAFENVYDKTNKLMNPRNPDGSYGSTLSVREFTTLMRDMHKTNKFVDKKKNRMISMCSYNSVGTCNSNIDYKTAITLDIDGCEFYDEYMSANELHEILTANKIPHFIHSSASNTVAKSKYRAYLFVNASMNEEEHTAVYKWVIKLIEDNGFKTFKLGKECSEATYLEYKAANPHMKYSGIDGSSAKFGQRYYSVGSLFGTPEEDMIWLEAYVNRNRDVTRHAIDVASIAIPYIEAEREKERLEAERKASIIPLDIEDDSKLGRMRRQVAANQWSTLKDKLIARIDSEINYGASRHHCALSLSGSIGKIEDYDIRLELYNHLYNRCDFTGGIGKETSSGMKKYCNI